jgi:hypothetical protein
MILKMMMRTLTEFLNVVNVGRNTNDTQLFYVIIIKKKITAAKVAWIRKCTALIYYEGEKHETKI